MTHVQPAQPVLLAHHLLAYVEMLERDRGRFRDAWSRADRSPLGAGALAGAGFPLDRDAVAAELGFGGVTANSLDAVSDRDFVVEALAAAALCMAHLSRLAEELVWWSSPAYGWVVLADAWSTGSSMMPNKKNPDPAELIRGRAGRVIGQLTGLLATLKGLPLAYQRDLQESVAPLLEGMAVLESSVRVMAGLIASLAVRPERMRAAALEGYVTATSVADTLVERGLPFRDAHGVVGALVADAESRGCRLDELPDDAFAAMLDLPASPDELRAAATLEAALARPRVVGGTAPERVREALAVARAQARRRGLISDQRASGSMIGRRRPAATTLEMLGHARRPGRHDVGDAGQRGWVWRQEVVDGAGLEGADDGDLVAGVAEWAARTVAPHLLVEDAAVDGGEAVADEPGLDARQREEDLDAVALRLVGDGLDQPAAVAAAAGVGVDGQRADLRQVVPPDAHGDAADDAAVSVGGHPEVADAVVDVGQRARQQQILAGVAMDEGMDGRRVLGLCASDHPGPPGLRGAPGSASADARGSMPSKICQFQRSSPASKARVRLISPAW